MNLNNIDIEEIFHRLSETIEPKLELDYINPYTLLVAVVLSAQSTDKGVNKATTHLFQIVSSPEEMIELGEEKLIKFIQTIGLYKNKAKYIINLSKMLVEKFNGQVPSKLEYLEQLPGVGRKSANVILNEIFNESTIIVDTHVLRLSHRLGFSFHKNPLKVEQDLEKKIPHQYRKNGSAYLVLHGRYTCKAKKPDCENCCINDLCLSFEAKNML